MMELFFPLLASLFSLVLLYHSSKWVIKHGIILAKILGISTFVFGFILVSISTSLPELSVAIFSSLYGEPGLSTGDVIGSNFVDLALVLGLCAVFGGAIHLKKKESLELLEMLFISFLVVLFLFYSESLNWIHGMILIGLFALLVKKMYSGGQVSKKIFDEEKASKRSVVLKFSASIFLLILSAEIFVGSVLEMIELLELTASFVGVTFVALGTSIPEISFELTAIKQKKYEIAMGDLFGSAVTNVTLVLGTLSIMNSGTPINIEPIFFLVPFMFVAILIIWYGLTVKKKISRNMGYCLLGLYFLYFALQASLLLPKY
jgi:cation:H+ antiporter